MRPQGYIGRGFPALYPELRLPGRIRDWNDDHQLIALAMRGEDCVGNLIIGEESLNRFLAGQPRSYTRADYPNLATGALAGQPGSSAGGEHPKFAVYSEGRHVLVKFASGDGAAADRWRDLLVCEHLALEVLREAGVPVPPFGVVRPRREQVLGGGSLRPSRQAGASRGDLAVRHQLPLPRR